MSSFSIKGRMDKTLNQLVDELRQKMSEVDEIGKEISEVVRPGTVIHLTDYLNHNFDNRGDPELTEEDFRLAVIVAVPGHGFSLMDIEGNLIKLIPQVENDEIQDNMGETVEDHEGHEDHDCELDYDDPISLITSYPGTIVGHVSDYMKRFIRGR